MKLIGFRKDHVLYFDSLILDAMFVIDLCDMGNGDVRSISRLFVGLRIFEEMSLVRKSFCNSIFLFGCCVF